MWESTVKAETNKSEKYRYLKNLRRKEGWTEINTGQAAHTTAKYCKLWNTWHWRGEYQKRSNKPLQQWQPYHSSIIFDKIQTTDSKFSGSVAIYLLTADILTGTEYKNAIKTIHNSDHSTVVYIRNVANWGQRLGVPALICSVWWTLSNWQRFGSLDF